MCARRTVIMSPGWIAGSMLEPHTRIVRLPETRSEAAASSITYELRRLVLQEACVATTLPQASAMVSNTRSRRKAGFTYRLLPDESADSPACSFLESLN